MILFSDDVDLRLAGLAALTASQVLLPPRSLVIILENCEPIARSGTVNLEKNSTLQFKESFVRYSPASPQSASKSCHKVRRLFMEIIASD